MLEKTFFHSISQTFMQQKNQTFKRRQFLKILGSLFLLPAFVGAEKSSSHSVMVRNGWILKEEDVA